MRRCCSQGLAVELITREPPCCGSLLDHQLHGILSFGLRGPGTVSADGEQKTGLCVEILEHL